MFINDEDIEKIREANDLVSVAAESVVLRQRGAEFWGCCPFHDEKTPSFKINPSLQLFHCFGCGAHGDVFQYIMQREHMDFLDAVNYLADRAHIELQVQESHKSGPKKTRLHELCQLTADFYHAQLVRSTSVQAQEAREYASSRHYTLELTKRWNLGYAPGDRRLVQYLSSRGFSAEEMLAANVAVQLRSGLHDRFYERFIFPIQDEFGKTIAFGGRVMKPAEPKYLNSQETKIFHKSRQLYALDKAKEFIVAGGQVLVVEGYTDAIALHESGIRNVVATLGTALTDRHVKLLSRFTKRIIYVFDGDDAGQAAAERALQFVGLSEADFFCVILPHRLDPAEFIEQYGSEAFEDLVLKAMPLVRFVIDKSMQPFDRSVPEQKARALQAALEALAFLKGSVLADEYASYIADKLSLDPDLVRRSLAKIPKPKAFSAVQGLKNEKEAYNVRVTHKFSGEQTQAPAEQHTSTFESLGSSAQTTQWRNGIQAFFQSSEDGRALKAEQELLALLVQYPEELRELAFDLAELSWLNQDHQLMCLSILSTPDDSDSSQVLAVATKLYPKVVESLSSAILASNSDVSVQETARFLLVQVEFLAAQRELREKRTQLKYPDSLSNEEYNRLFGEVTSLQRKINELDSKLKEASKRES